MSKYNLIKLNKPATFASVVSSSKKGMDVIASDALKTREKKLQKTKNKQTKKAKKNCMKKEAEKNIIQENKW